MAVTALRLEIPLLEAEAKLWLTTEREHSGEVVLEIIPSSWEGELPGFRLRWRLDTKALLALQKHMRLAVLPIARTQANVICDYQPGENVAVTFFVRESEVNNIIDKLGIMATYIARKGEVE